jgi:cation transport ATPase
MKNILRFVWGFTARYPLFGTALFGALMALGLDAGGLDKYSHSALIFTCVVVVAIVVGRMFRSVRMRIYGVNIVAIAAIVTSVLVHEYWTAMVLTLVLAGEKVLEDFAENHAKKDIKMLAQQPPREAHVLHGRKVVDIAASEVKPGNKIIIKIDEKCPVDAQIIDGQTTFTPSPLSGEISSQTANTGDTVLSGAVNQNAEVTARALQTAAASHYELALKIVQNATGTPAPFARLANRYIIPFNILAFGISGTVWSLTSDPVRFLQILVVATPFSLVLTAPVAVIAGLNRAAKHGVLAKTSAALERLAETKTFAFVKTDKKTIGQLRKQGIKNFLLLTSDDKVSAKTANIKNVYVANASDMIDAVESTADHPVTFASDNANDAPALTASDTGVAIGVHGAALASSSADIMVARGEPTDLALAHKIAKQTFATATKNILAGIGLSVTLMAIFAAGRIQPIYGADAQAALDLLILFTVLRSTKSAKSTARG